MVKLRRFKKDKSVAWYDNGGKNV
uniref:Uncharacterized protein n=1 Tax=Anguilla anguilla TaxID=7936 RepID=A0A0E9T5V7_ANGAN